MKFPVFRCDNALIFLLAATLFLGCGMIAMMPPFEGFDETAHFSRIFEYAVENPDPVSNPPKHITREVYDYFRIGPMPAGWIFNEDMHARDPLFTPGMDYGDEFWSYARFFDAPPMVRSYQQYRLQLLPTIYRSSPQSNWQYQHPALYYRMAGFALKTFGVSTLHENMLALRLFSFTLAFAGLVIGIMAARRHHRLTATPDSADIWPAFLALYPFLMPSFFGDVARLGNDTAGLFLFGVLWTLLLAYVRHPGHLRISLALGAVMALCLATKMLFFPVLAGIGGYILLFQILAPHSKGLPLWRCLLPLVLLAFGGLTVFLLLGNDAVGGLIQPDGQTPHGTKTPDQPRSIYDILMHEDNFSMDGFAKSLAVLSLSMVYLWNSWSIANESWVSVVAFALAMTLFGAYLEKMRSIQLKDMTQLPLWCFLPLMAGLVWFALVMSVRRGFEIAPGYYVNILAPALAVMTALGMEMLCRRRWGNLWLGLILSWVFLVTMPIVWKHLAIFAGCHAVRKNAIVYDCVDAVPFALIRLRLEILAYPMLGLCFFLVGYASLAVGLILLYRRVAARLTAPCPA